MLLDQLQANIENDRWIDSSQDLPDQGKRVWAHIDGCRPNIGYPYIDADYCEALQYEGNWVDVISITPILVDRWRYLPQVDN